MNKKYNYLISTLIILVLAACGSAEPTMSAEDLANTAVANAWISITQTQAALPTATPVPPTFTPAPTATLAPTLPPLPTIPPGTAAVIGAPTTDPCNQIPQLEPKGALTTVEFTNDSQGQVNLSFGMTTPNDKAECYTYSFGLGRGDVVSAKVLVGCYWGYAWITGDEPSVARTGSTIICLPDSNIIYHVKVTKETIVLR